MEEIERKKEMLAKYEEATKKLDTLDHKNINNYVDANLSLAKILSNKKEFNDT